MGGALDLIGPLGQRFHVTALGERRRRELSLHPGLGISEAGVPGPVRCELLGSEQLKHGALLVRSLQRPQRGIQRRLAEPVGDQDRHARSLAADRPDQLLVVGHAAGGKRLQPGKERRRRPTAAAWRAARGFTLGEHGQTHAVERREGDVRDRARQPSGGIGLVGLAPVHRPAEVDEETQRQFFLGDEESQHEAIESRVGVPVDQAKIVAGRVVAIVGELDRLTPAL